MQDLKNAFVEKIRKTLTDHGFPTKRVSLPLEKMYQVAEEKGTNFNVVLGELESLGIGHEKNADKIIFFSKLEEAQEAGPSYESLMDRFKDMDPAELMKNPQKILESMSPQDMQAIQEMYQRMSPAERDQLLRKAKEMF